MSKQSNRTAIAFLMQGIFYFIGNGFFDTHTVLPIFIEQVTGQLSLAGAPSTIRQVCTFFFQVLFGTYIVCSPNVPRFIGRVMAIGFCTPLVVALGIKVGFTGLSLAFLCLIMVAVMWSCDGLLYIGYYDLMGRTLEAPVRAKVLGMQQLLGGIGALGSAFVIKIVMDSPNFDDRTRYILLFVLGGIILLCAAGSMGFIKDVKNRRNEETFNLTKQFKELPDCWKKNARFRSLMLIKTLFTISISSTPYLLLFCRDNLGLESETVSTLLNVQILGSLLGGAICSWFAPRKGNMFTVCIFCALSVTCSLLGLLAITKAFSVFWLAVLSVLAGGLANASWAGLTNALLDVTDGEKIHSYLLLNSIISLPLAVTTILAGALAESFGYGITLFSCLVFALPSFILAIILVKKLNRSKEMIIKGD